MKFTYKSYIQLALIVAISAFVLRGNNAWGQKPLVLGVSTDVSNIVVRKNASKAIAAYLSTKLNRKIEVVLPEKNKQLIEMLQDKKVDIAFLNTFGYILTSAEANITPIAVISSNGSTPTSYKSCIIKNRSVNKINSINDIKKKEVAANISFKFVNPTSTSGHLIPRLYFNSLGLNYTESHFKEVTFGNNHQNTIMQIKQNKADLGACSYEDLQKLIQQGKLKKEDLKVLWVSKPIVNGPIAVRKDLDANTQKTLTEAFLKMADEAPQLQAKVKKIWHAKGDKPYFVKAQDVWYNPIREMANSIEELILILSYYTD
ncbi:MAG TPA: hypothetical protein DCS93_15600 [Microscillaceae bacterium]|nr:hypothetical protein [Microscillaceae bacterium]